MFQKILCFDSSVTWSQRRAADAPKMSKGTMATVRNRVRSPAVVEGEASH